MWALMQGFIPSNWAWLYEPMLGHWGIGPGHGDRWACPGRGVTLESHQVAVGALQEVKGKAVPVNRLWAEFAFCTCRVHN